MYYGINIGKVFHRIKRCGNNQDSLLTVRRERATNPRIPSSALSP